MNVYNWGKLNQKSFNSHILLAIFCMVLLYVYKKTNQKYMYWLNSFIQQCIDIKYFHLIETILTTHASKTSIVHLVKLNLCISLVLLYAAGTINDIVLRSVCKGSSFISYIPHRKLYSRYFGTIGLKQIFPVLRLVNDFDLSLFMST